MRGCARYPAWLYTWHTLRFFTLENSHMLTSFVIKSGVKGCFWGVFFALFWQIWQFGWGVIFLYGLCICCVVYMMYMFSLNQEQLCIMGWVVTLGCSIILCGLTLLCTYCLYCLYKVVKNFSNKNWCFVELMIYINIMRVQYTHIKRWDTFTNCECVGGDIV
jgi:hypothetical protein